MRIPAAPIKGLSWRYHLTILDFIVILTGLVFSPPLLSIGLIGISVVGMLDIPKGINPAWLKNIKTGLSDPFNWAVASLYLLLLFGIWQTDDWGYYFERLRIKVALLSVPIGWWGLPKLRTQHRHFIMAFFSLLMAVTAVFVLINYALHFAEIQLAIKEGRAIPVPRNHIRFSLLVALATIGALELWRKGVALPAPTPRRPAVLREQSPKVKGSLDIEGNDQFYATGKASGWSRYLWPGLALFLFLFQHILAVRSGLACAYLGISAMLFAFLVDTKRWKAGLAALAFLLFVPLAGYQTVPSLRAKMDYLSYELWRQREGLDSQEYSDAGRLTSIRFGLELWKGNPILGVGPGNLRQEMDRLYANRLPQAEAKRPHNQFVSVLAGSGLVGILVYGFAFGYLLFGKSRWRDPAFLAVFVILVASCLVENTLENSAGLGLFCFFIFFYRPLPDGTSGADQVRRIATTGSIPAARRAG